MTFLKHYILFVFLLLVSISNLLSQNQEEAFVKSSYLINFIEEIRWENDEEMNNFSVGILGNEDIAKRLTAEVKNLIIRNKSIDVVSFNELEDIKEVDVLYISPSFSKKRFSRYDIAGANCLLVSDNEQGVTNMINFYAENSQIKFTLNLKNLKTKGFKTSLKLLVFGGYSDEVLGVFYESEEALKKEKDQLRERNKEIKEKEMKIFKLSQEINLKEDNIDKLKSNIDNSSDQLDQQRKNEQLLNESLLEQKGLIAEYNHEIKEFESLNNQTENDLNTLQNQLVAKKNQIDENNEILLSQQEKISKQKQLLTDKDTKLKTSFIAVSVVLALLFLSIFLFYYLYKANKAKKNALHVIEEKNLEILKASEHKDEFLANMSHEIRTPLNAIVGFSNLLLSKSKNEENKQFLSKILLSSNNLLKIINEILDISKIESGKIDIEVVDFDFHNLVQNAFQSLNVNVPGRDFSYHLKIDDDVPQFIRSDSTKIIQIIINLLGNAIKFTEKGEVSLTISKAGVKCDGTSLGHKKGDIIKCLKFTFLDTGIGISKERQASIFEKFTQEDVSITRKHGGTGLGLPITEKLVTLLGGKIELESELGKGSVFKVTLPLLVGENLDEAISDEDVLLVEGIENIKIIIADDHQLNRESVIQQFKQWNPNVEVAEATDGIDLLKKIGEEEYDVVLTDVRMPNMGGIEATQKIREKDKHIVIIGLSANATSKGIEEGKAAGMNGYLTKPVRFNDLLQSITQFVNLPYTVIKNDTTNTEKYTGVLAPIKRISLNKKEFSETVNELVTNINGLMKKINDGDLTYDTMHSLLNKSIYINDEELINYVRELQDVAKLKKDKKLNQQIDKLNIIWAVVEDEIKMHLPSEN